MKYWTSSVRSAYSLSHARATIAPPPSSSTYTPVRAPINESNEPSLRESRLDAVHRVRHRPVELAQPVRQARGDDDDVARGPPSGPPRESLVDERPGLGARAVDHPHADRLMVAIQSAALARSGATRSRDAFLPEPPLGSREHADAAPRTAAMPTPMLYCTGQILKYAPAVPKSSVPIASPPVAPRPITRVVVSWSNDHRRPKRASINAYSAPERPPSVPNTNGPDSATHV